MSKVHLSKKKIPSPPPPAKNSLLQSKTQTRHQMKAHSVSLGRLAGRDILLKSVSKFEVYPLSLLKHVVHCGAHGCLIALWPVAASVAPSRPPPHRPTPCTAGSDAGSIASEF